MAKLILSLEGQVIKEIELNKMRMTIGRKPHNDIPIENLAVSGEHAAITSILNDSFLEDMDSTNGTLVNGVAVKKHVLQHKDVIEIGKFRLEYSNSQNLQNSQNSQASQEAPDFGRATTSGALATGLPKPAAGTMPAFADTWAGPAMKTPTITGAPRVTAAQAMVREPTSTQTLSGTHVGKALAVAASWQDKDRARKQEENSRGKLVWNDQLCIGIDVIDQQHRRIVEYINQLDDARSSGYSREEMGLLINELVDYTISHFGFEESLQEDAKYPFINAHKKVHELFTKRVAEFQVRFSKGEDISRELNSLLVAWLFNHIKRDDTDYVGAVKAHLQRQTDVVDKKKGLFARLFRL